MVARPVPFEVHRGDDLIATGFVNGDALTLAPGTYRIQVLTTEANEPVNVVIEPRGEHRVTVN